ncbi:MAG: methyltransferase domain-containing protein [Labilithrix sp.]|nr:methyltransferase domain-containing protein [Labilithrix sp.]
MDLSYNRIKFFFAGGVLEVANGRIPGRPHDEIVRRIASLAPERCLEICGGTGYGARLLAEALPRAEIASLDLSPENVAFGKRALARSPRGNVDVVEGDASALAYADDHFDVVFSVLGVHEMPSEVRRRALREARRVLRPGGHLVVADLDEHASWPRAFDVYLRVAEPRYAREVLGDGLRGLVTAAGFEIVAHRARMGSLLPFQTLEARKL